MIWGENPLFSETPLWMPGEFSHQRCASKLFEQVQRCWKSLWNLHGNFFQMISNEHSNVIGSLFSSYIPKERQLSSGQHSNISQSWKNMMLTFLGKKNSCIQTKAFRILYQQSNLNNVSIFDQVDMCGTQYYQAHIRSQWLTNLQLHWHKWNCAISWGFVICHTHTCYKSIHIRLLNQVLL